LDEALVDERRNSVDVGVRNRLRSVECEAACEDGEPPEQSLILRRKKGATPVDRRAQRPMTRGRIAATAFEHRQSPVEPLEQRCRR
jgi:hypothetical protein